MLSPFSFIAIKLKAVCLHEDNVCDQVRPIASLLNYTKLDLNSVERLYLETVELNDDLE